ncbi:MAG: GntR family transcriptional regulator [Thermoplasmata archaeon]|nr:MAG: GntR family transcriptional regulator [Thermoplasmata archaeon]
MLLNLTDLSDEPLQSQIIRQIRAKILAGELSAGDALPSIRRLAREQHISVITVQRAYESLEREGLIYSRRGKGFFVSKISDKEKKKMARERMRENLEPQITISLAEGLSEHDVTEVINLILEERKTIKKQRRKS